MEHITAFRGQVANGTTLLLVMLSELNAEKLTLIACGLYWYIMVTYTQGLYIRVLVPAHPLEVIL